MDVSGALPEAISLEFRDEEWIQTSIMNRSPSDVEGGMNMVT